MHHINTMPELNGQCRDSPLKHGQQFSSCCGKMHVNCPSLSFVDTVGLPVVYTSAVVHCLYIYDLRSVRESKTILHQLYAVV